MLFNEIEHFIEVYNNSVIELVQSFGTSFFGRIDHLASSVIKSWPKNSVPKHCIRSITYHYLVSQNEDEDSNIIYNDGEDSNIIYNDGEDSNIIYNDGEDSNIIYNDDGEDSNIIYNDGEDSNIIYNDDGEDSNIIYNDDEDSNIIYNEDEDSNIIYSVYPCSSRTDETKS